MGAITALGFLLALPAQGVVADVVEDAKKFQGTWAVTPATFDGVPDENARKEGIKAIKAMRFTFRESKLTINGQPAVPGGEKGDEEMAYRLDATKRPKRIDLGDNVRGIYVLEGDRLKLCLDIRGKENGRPTKFGFDKDKPTVVYYVLKREKN